MFTSLLISHVTENTELLRLSNKLVWLFIQWCYTMLSFQSSFGTHFFKLLVVLCSARDLYSSPGEQFIPEKPFSWRVTCAAHGEASDVPLLRGKSPSLLSCPEAHGTTCCCRAFMNTVCGRAKQQDFG